MKRTWKQIGSLLMSVCMVLTMLPAMAFAEAQDSGVHLGAIGAITAFAESDEEIAGQTVKTDTQSEEPNLPETLADGITPPVITETVAVPATPVLQGAIAPLGAESGIDIDESNFPDANFRDWLKNSANIGSVGSDGVLTPAEIAGITAINVENKDIADLTGIRHFTALKQLSCPKNKLTTLNASGLTALTYLDCSGNQLGTLDVSSLTQLARLECGSNQLTTLNMNGLTQLTGLTCSNNRLSTLDVSGLPQIEGLNCSSNQLSTLNVNGTQLKGLTCSDNLLSTLDVSSLTQLVLLDCTRNYMFDESAITGLDKGITTTFSFLPQTAIGISPSNFPDANFRAWLEGGTNIGGAGSDGMLTPDEIAGITNIYVSGKNIASLTGIEHFTALKTLNCSVNQLTTLGTLPIGLTTLGCGKNDLSGSLDLSGLTALTSLNCSDNRLTSLILNSGATFTDLQVDHNLMTASSDVTGPTVNWNNGLLKFAPQRLSAPTGLQWNPAKAGEAMWAGVTNASTYEAELYMNDSKVEGAGWHDISGSTWKFDSSKMSVRTARYTFRVKAAPANNSTDWASSPWSEYSVVYTPGTDPTITTLSLPDGYVGRSYDVTLTAVGTGTLKWTVDQRPAGVQYDTSGHMLGAPTQAGTFTVVATVENSGGFTHTKTFPMTVHDSDLYPVTVNEGTINSGYITVSGVKKATEGTEVGFRANAPQNGQRFKEWTVVKGDSVAVTPSLKSQSILVTMPAAEVELTATYEAIPQDIITSVFSFYFKGEDGGYLPSTLKVNVGSTYQISPEFIPSNPTNKQLTLSTRDSSVATVDPSGKVTAVGVGKTILEAVAEDGGYYVWHTVEVPAAAAQAYAITVNDGMASAATAHAGETVTIVASSFPGQQFKQWNISPSGGLIFLEGTGITSPVAKFTMPAGAVTATATYTLSAAPTITTSSLPSGMVGTAYSQTLTATSAGPVTWSIESDVLPDGLSLNAATGVIAGTPTLPGTFSFTVKAANGTAPDATKTLSIKIDSLPSADAQMPTITGQPVGATYTKGAAATALSVTASVSDGGILSYQWYGGSHSELVSPISGATAASFTPSTGTVGTMYYRVEVTNTNNSASGSKTATIHSWQIAVTVQGGGGGDSGNGGGGGGGNIPPTPPVPGVSTDKQPNQPTTARQSVTGTVKDGVLGVTITEQTVRDAIKAAQDAAKKSGKEIDGIALEFAVTVSDSYTNLNTAIDPGAIDRLKEAGAKFIKIGSSVLDITIDAGAIAEIDKQSSGTVSVSAKKLTKLSDAAKKLIGNRPVFDITVSDQKNGKTETVSNFGKGTVTLGLAYKAANNENTGNLFGVYVDKNGKPQLLTNSRYADGRLIFSRNSLSTYGVGYKAPAPAFTDTAKHWAKDNIDFVASLDLISGTSATTFAPDTAITRADFLMALGRFSGADVSIYKISSFTDVKAGDTAMPYIEWAVKNKIVQGIGDNKFGPVQQISRQDMAVMMLNYAKATSYKLPTSVAIVTFSDGAKISAYAQDAVTAIQQAGVMQGKGNNTFDPQGNATRAEASTILRGFLE